MTTWILILVLTGPAGDAIQIETVAAPFASYQACSEAGMEARALPVLTRPKHVWNRIDWTCVPTGYPPAASPVPSHGTSLSARSACSKPEARARLREEIRKAREAVSPSAPPAGDTP